MASSGTVGRPVQDIEAAVDITDIPVSEIEASGSCLKFLKWNVTDEVDVLQADGAVTPFMGQLEVPDLLRNEIQDLGTDSIMGYGISRHD